MKKCKIYLDLSNKCCTYLFSLVDQASAVTLVLRFTGQWEYVGFKSKVLECSNKQWNRMDAILSHCVA